MSKQLQKLQKAPTKRIIGYYGDKTATIAEPTLKTYFKRSIKINTKVLKSHERRHQAPKYLVIENCT
jgi:hypothetical protein